MSDMYGLMTRYASSPTNFNDQLFTLLVEQNAQLSDQQTYGQLLLELIRGFAEAEKQLIELNDLKNRFLGMAAHDLRNPLSAIRGYCDLILSGEMDKESEQEFLQAIRQVSDQMLNLVNDLLDVSVIESGNLRLRLEPIDLAVLLKTRIALLAPAAVFKQIEIIFDILVTPRIQGDRDRLSQVLDNLLTNALKFSYSHTQINIKLWQEDNHVYLDVCDQGPGLREEDRQRIFGAFQKLSALPTGGEKSTGLGLSIVKKIIDAHGGSISAFNNPDQGCTFRVCFNTH